MSNRKLWIVKAGSQMVIAGGPPLLRKWMTQVDRLNSEFDIDVIWVTSGAIATARRHFPLATKKTNMVQKQALSALGQPLVHQQYAAALKKSSRTAAQVLLTADDLGDPKRRKNLVRTLTTLVMWNILPILNENDAVATEEIQFGDNDRLSALVAKHMKADRLILLTDVEGLFDRDPRTPQSPSSPPAKIISHVPSVSKKLLASLSGASPSGVGSGGMLSKILAGQTAHRSGVVTHLIKGDRPEALLDLARNKTMIGTTIGTTGRRTK